MQSSWYNARMDGVGLAIFETAIGSCGIVWGPHGIRAIELPARDAARTRARIRQRWPRAVERDPPARVRTWIGSMVRLLAGERVDLGDVHLDMDGVPDLNRSVYEIARAIPPSETRTYGDIAMELGDRLLARAVGQALGQNPFPIVVPCHRVLGARGAVGGFSAPGGRETKARMLAIEGVQVGRQLALL
jgi:methylated-DNA-[protein]-cysteine S-methyltransferase